MATVSATAPEYAEKSWPLSHIQISSAHGLTLSLPLLPFLRQAARSAPSAIPPIASPLIVNFKKCHEDHSVQKFLGACNDPKIQLDKCFREEKQVKLKANFKARKQFKEELRASKAAKSAFEFTISASAYGAGVRCLFGDLQLCHQGCHAAGNLFNL